MAVRVAICLLCICSVVSLFIHHRLPVIHAEKTMLSPPATLEDQLALTEESIKRIETRHHGSPVETWPQPERVIWHEYQESHKELLRRHILRNQ